MLLFSGGWSKLVRSDSMAKNAKVDWEPQALTKSASAYSVHIFVFYPLEIHRVYKSFYVEGTLDPLLQLDRAHPRTHGL
jgi:hypothetical protein